MSCTPSIISENLAVVLSWAAIRVQNSIVSLSEVHNKTIEVNGFTVPLIFEHVLLYQTSQYYQITRKNASVKKYDCSPVHKVK